MSDLKKISLIFQKPHLSYLKENIEQHYFLYEGSSMFPLLKTLDIIITLPLQNQKVVAGDVVVYHDPDKKRVVHRIVSVNDGKILTRGDSSKRIDSYTIGESDIIGRATYVQRGKRIHRILGGKKGLVFISILKGVHLLKSILVHIFHPIYTFFNRTKLLAKILPVRSRFQILNFDRPEGKEYQLVYGKRLVGWRPPGQEKWILKYVYRLLIDEKSLP